MPPTRPVLFFKNYCDVTRALYGALYKPRVVQVSYDVRKQRMSVPNSTPSSPYCGAMMIIVLISVGYYSGRNDNLGGEADEGYRKSRLIRLKS